MSKDWSEKAAWMRVVHATDASWSPDGQLLSLRLGSEPSPDTNPAEKTETPQQRAFRERRERREMSLRASGGPVIRLDEGD